MSFKSGLMNIMPECCKGCSYRIRESSNVSMCDYAFQTGKLRNCKPEDCPYYKPRGKKKK